ncbi:MAG TPA: insulinase family protein [Mycobacteriales bacterium]
MTATPVLRCDVPGSALTAVQLHVGVGSGSEGPGERGLAHALEHLVVRAALGGLRVDAATTRDATTYSAVVLRADAGARARALLAALGELAVDRVVLDAELATIRQERAQRENEVAWAVQQALFARLWEGSPYAHPTLGDPAVVDGLTCDRAGEYHRRWYSPARAVLVVAGAGAAPAPDVPPRASPGPTLTGSPPPRPTLTAPTPTAPTPTAPTPTAVRAAAVEVRLPGRPAAHGIGLTDHPGGRDPEVRAALACRVVRAAAGLAVTSLPVGDALATWALISGAATCADAVRHVLSAVDRTLDLLGSRGTADGLVSAAQIHELRGAGDVAAVAARAARAWWDHGVPPRPGAREDAVLGTGAADLAAELARWRRHWTGLR